MCAPPPGHPCDGLRQRHRSRARPPPGLPRGARLRRLPGHRQRGRAEAQGGVLALPQVGEARGPGGPQRTTDLLITMRDIKECLKITFFYVAM